MNATSQDPLERALRLPNGARFYKSALQVNPFEYLKRHQHPSSFEDESSYNQAIVRACEEHGIEVVAVTDHYRVQTARRLLTQLTEADIHAFPGFEAETKDGIHVLCLFEPGRPLEQIDRIIGRCDIHDHAEDSPRGGLDIEEILEKQREWECVCVAAHVTTDKGLLEVLSGQSRAEVWKDSNLLACSIARRTEDEEFRYQKILENRDDNYRRTRRLAVLNAQDVSDPSRLSEQSSWSWIKMSSVSVEGLRQAFLDPESRIRLASDSEPPERLELLALTWEGGFLDRQAIHFNENLNVLIGGRGAGKSTVVESLRYVLDLEPRGEEAKKTHQGLIRQVLGSGTKISLWVQSHRPSAAIYRIDRTIPNPPIVKDEQGNVSKLTPQEACRPGKIEIFGQHEIAEIARSPEQRTRLLDRFVDHDSSRSRRRSELVRQLTETRKRLLELENEHFTIQDRLASLPRLEETLRRFQDSGLEEKLQEKSLLVREERVLNTAFDRLSPFRKLSEELRMELPVDQVFLSEKALEDLPNRETLAEMRGILSGLQERLQKITSQLGETLENTETELENVRSKWKEKEREAQARYEASLRELKGAAVDGEDFIRLRQEIEDLRPLRESREQIRRDLADIQQRRRNLLAEWEDFKNEELRKLQRAARKVTKDLSGNVRVQVTPEGNREPLFELLREKVGGRLSETESALRDHAELSLSALAQDIRSGEEALRAKYGLTPVQARSLAESPPEVSFLIEELELAPTTEIRLNVSTGDTVTWKKIEDLSAGQKATAVLLLLLLGSKAPLIVDQPEDDLDNRFVTEGVVPEMREKKQERQFLFTTHNANIPVLGDAELILGLEPLGEADGGEARIPTQTMGSIDDKAVQALIEDLLEGGKDAFELRRLKYGF